MKHLLLSRVFNVIILSSFFLGGCVNSQNESTQNETSSNTKEVVTNISFEDLEKEYDARLGIYAFNTGNNKSIEHRENERFGYASTHKALAVGVLLKNKSIEELNENIPFTEEDLVNYNPITEKFVGKGMTLKELSDASLRYSDNTAANLIFESIGGPKGLKRELRKIGDNVTEPTRIEPELNNVAPGKINDTSTPKALAESLKSFTLGDVLSVEKQELLNNWMKQNTTGDNLIRAGVPEDWIVGDRTGAGSYGTRNCIAILWPPGNDPIIISILSSREKLDADYNDELIAKATELVISQLKKE